MAFAVQTFGGNTRSGGPLSRSGSSRSFLSGAAGFGAAIAASLLLISGIAAFETSAMTHSAPTAALQLALAQLHATGAAPRHGRLVNHDRLVKISKSFRLHAWSESGNLTADAVHAHGSKLAAVAPAHALQVLAQLKSPARMAVPDSAPIEMAAATIIPPGRPASAFVQTDNPLLAARALPAALAVPRASPTVVAAASPIEHAMHNIEETAKQPTQLALATTGSDEYIIVPPKTPSVELAQLDPTPSREEPFGLVLQAPTANTPVPLPMARPGAPMKADVAIAPHEPQRQSRPVTPVLAYARPDVEDDDDKTPSYRKPLFAPQARNGVAVYDISANTVYLPGGERLEAHSGIGPMRDNPRFIKQKNRGPTPPHTYDLTMRESLFHGVEAIRLTPLGGEEAIFNRNGLLAHTYMLGPRGDSNGCVSFKDYKRFLAAYKRGEVRRLVVVPSMPSGGSRIASLFSSGA